MGNTAGQLVGHPTDRRATPSEGLGVGSIPEGVGRTPCGSEGEPRLARGSRAWGAPFGPWQQRVEHSVGREVHRREILDPWYARRVPLRGSGSDGVARADASAEGLAFACRGCESTRTPSLPAWGAADPVEAGSGPGGRPWYHGWNKVRCNAHPGGSAESSQPHAPRPVGAEPRCVSRYPRPGVADSGAGVDRAD